MQQKYFVEKKKTSQRVEEEHKHKHKSKAQT